ncbi:MAG: rhodanese-like domain-containing protein [Actinobacteria bacterium]|nr:rhodanese-like domain-containing protein [Actinomycetota bacterium]
MKKKILFVALVSALLLSACGEKTVSVTNLGPADFQSKSQTAGVVTIDVRTPDEYNAGHIKGAINIDVDSATFDSDIAKLNKSTTYAVYCHSGRRSGIATEKMAKTKFTSIYNLTDGIQVWLASGLPLVRTT